MRFQRPDVFAAASFALATALIVPTTAVASAASSTATSTVTSSPVAVPGATWRDCDSYARRARTGCLTGQFVQPWAACPASLVGWFTLTKATSSLVRCKKSGASTKWVWA